MPQIFVQLKLIMIICLSNHQYICLWKAVSDLATSGSVTILIVVKEFGQSKVSDLHLIWTLNCITGQRQPQTKLLQLPNICSQAHT